MNKDLLKYCKYYKGEDTKHDTNDSFWILERNYYSSVYPENHEYWEKGEGLDLCINTFPTLKDFIMKQDITTRGFLACTAIYSYSHNPMGNIEYLLNYGKE